MLSNEAPGYGISAMVNAGYGDDNLYQTLVAIRAGANPSTSGILTDNFLKSLEICPDSSQIFTTQLKDVNSPGTAVAISTDGTVRTVSIYGSIYNGAPATLTLDTVVYGAGTFRAIYENTSDTVYSPQFGMNLTTPLTSWSINGPLAGMTTTYNVFGILYDPSPSSSPSPSTTSTPTNQSTPTPSAPEFSPIAILLAFTTATTLVATAKIKKKRTQ